MGGRLAILSCLCVLGGASAAVAATNPQLVYLQKTLKASMVATFKKEAPTLKITTVTCKLPADGVTARCTANFTVSGVTGYYPVTATIESNGQLKWSAASPKCKNAKTGKAISC